MSAASSQATGQATGQPPKKLRVAWVTTWSRPCGVADYSKVLWPEVRAALEKRGHSGELVSLDEFGTSEAVLAKLRELHPDLIHFQHEYGIFGGKTPPFYEFPRLVHRLRAALPGASLVATAHTLLKPDYTFPIQGRGWLQAPARFLANMLLLRPLRRLWGPGTWGILDGAMAHSEIQVRHLEQYGARVARGIPVSVPIARASSGTADTDTDTVSGTSSAPRESRLLLFGFFSPEKGQDVAIEALGKIPAGKVRLILAGSVRRERDRPYHDRCLARARELGVFDRLELTGYVDEAKLDALYAGADLVLTPFRETSGSASLPAALARGAAVLASDIPLNRDINDRVPGAVALFRSEDPEDCARQILKLVDDRSARARLREGARRYAEEFAPGQIALRHLEFYEAVRAR